MMEAKLQILKEDLELRLGDVSQQIITNAVGFGSVKSLKDKEKLLAESILKLIQEVKEGE